jgi:hypothetical protein
MNRNFLKFLLLLGIFFVICAPSYALKLTNSPQVYLISNNTTITHVFYCSLEGWEEQHLRHIIVNTSSAAVLNISPSSFNLSTNFIIPVKVTIYANNSDTVIPVSFSIPPSQYQTIGVIEIQHRREIQNLTPTPTPIPQINSSEKGIALPFPIAFTLDGMKILGPKQPQIVPILFSQINNPYMGDPIIVLIVVLEIILFGGLLIQLYSGR